MKLLRIGCFVGISLTCALVPTFFLSDYTAVDIYRYCAYPLVVLMYGLLIVAIAKSPWFAPSKVLLLFRKKNWAVLATFFLVAIIFLSHGKWEFKTIMDEVLLVGTSQGLHLERQPLYPSRVYDVQGAFSILSAHMDKRPIPFSVLLSFVHDLTGYRIENAFLLNNLIGLGSLVLIGVLGFRIHGRLGSILGIVLLGGLPVFVNYSHGAGFDVFNIFLVLLTIWLAIRWYEDGSDYSMLAFVFSGALLCHSRYEAPLFALAIGIIILVNWLRHQQIQLPWLSMIVPVFLMLILVQQSIFKVREEYWELDSIAEADSVFGLKYFYDNLGHAINYFWDLTDIYPNSPWLSSMGLFAFVVVLVKMSNVLKFKIRQNPELWIWGSFGLGLLMHFLLMMFYFYGQFDKIALHRFSLPTYLLFVLCSIACLNFFNSKHAKHIWVGIAAVGFFAYSIPVNAKRVYSENYLFTSYANWISDFVDENQGKRILVVAKQPLIWVVNGVSSVSYRGANLAKAKIDYQLNYGYFDEIFVVDLWVRNAETGLFHYYGENMISEAFDLEEIDKHFLEPSVFLRVAKVIDVDLAESTDTDAKGSEDDNSMEQEQEAFEFQHESKAQEEFYLNLP